MLIKTFGSIKNVKYTKRYAVRAIVVQDNKIVLNQNLKGNFYELPGGGKEDESLKEAVVREVKEETGLKVIPIKKLCVVNEILNIDDKSKFCVSHGYVCKISREVKIKPEKGNKILLVTPIEAMALIKNSKTTNPLAKYAQARDIFFIKQFIKKI